MRHPASLVLRGYHLSQVGLNWQARTPSEAKMRIAGLRCGKVDKGTVECLRTRSYRNHAILGAQGGEPWIASSYGHAMVPRCVRPSSWARLRISRQPVKS